MQSHEVLARFLVINISHQHLSVKPHPMGSLRRGMRRHDSTYAQMLYRLNGKQSSSTTYDSCDESRSMRRCVSRSSAICHLPSRRTHRSW